MIPVKPPFVTVELEIQIRKTLHTSKLQAVRDLHELSPFDKEVPNYSVPSGIRLVRTYGLKELKDYIDTLTPIADSLTELDKLVGLVESMESRIEVIKTIEIVNLLNNQFPNLTNEQRVLACTDWEYLKKLIRNNIVADKFGI